MQTTTTKDFIKQKTLLLTNNNGTYSGKLLMLNWEAAAADAREQKQEKQVTKTEGAGSQSADALQLVGAAARGMLEDIDEDDDFELEGKEKKKNTINTRKDQNESSMQVAATGTSSAAAAAEQLDHSGAADVAIELPEQKQRDDSTAATSESESASAERDFNQERQERVKQLPLLHPPLAVLISDALDLPEPSFAPFAKHLLNTAIVSHVLIPHIRGFEVSSCQKENSGSGYSLAELGSDVLCWIDEMVFERKIVPPEAGVVLVAHGIVGGLLAEVVNALFWGRREAVLKNQRTEMSNFWSSSKSQQQQHCGAGHGSNTSGQHHRPIDAARLCLIRGVIFLGSAPSANLVHRLETRRLLETLLTAKRHSLWQRMLLLWRCCWLYVCCFIAFLAPVLFVERRFASIVKSFWRCGRSEAQTSCVVQHFHLGGTDRSTLKAEAAAKVNTSSDPYRSSILRSTSSPLDVCVKAQSQFLVELSAFVLGFEQTDIYAYLLRAAEKRASYVKMQQDVDEQQERLRNSSKSSENADEHKRRSGAVRNGSLLLLSQLPRLQRDSMPSWDDVAAAVPVLSVMSMPVDDDGDDLSVTVAPLGLGTIIVEEALSELDLMRKPAPVGGVSPPRVVLTAPSSAASMVTIKMETPHYAMHRISSEDENDDLTSPSFLCALAAAKFIRRGILFERVQVAAQRNQKQQQEQEEGQKPKKIKK